MMTNKMMKNANVNPGTTTQAKHTSFLPKTTTPKPTPIDRLKDWWKKRFGSQKARQATSKSVALSIEHAINSFARAMRFNLILALIAMLVVEFCPEVSGKCPVFFQLCEGILLFYEFLLKVAFTLLKAFVQLFTLNWPGAADSLSAMFAEGGRLLSELINWVQAITF